MNASKPNSDCEISIAEKTEFLQSFLQYVRTDTYAYRVQHKDGSADYYRKDAPITDVVVLGHIENRENIAAFVPQPASATSLIGVFDLDDHEDEVPWDIMQKIGRLVLEAARRAGYMPWIVRSSGGRGIHIFVRFDVPQDCGDLRNSMQCILEEIGYEEGTAGVSIGEIEIFPKSSGITEYGSLIAIPFGRASTPLNEDMEPISTIPLWYSSAPIPSSPRAAPQGHNKVYEVDEAKLVLALKSLSSDDYHDWIGYGHAIKNDFGEKGFRIWNEWSAKSDNYCGETKIQAVWKKLKPNGRLTTRTIFFKAGVSQDSEAHPSPAKWPPALEEAAFIGLAGEIVRAIEPNTEADPVALLLQFLAAFGNSAGRSAYYQIEGDKHFSNIFVALVGDTSKARKGTSWGRIRQIFENIEMDDWADKRVLSGLSTGEGLINQVRDPVEKEITNDKGMVVKEFEDEGVIDKRLLIQQSEFASILRVMKRETNTLSGIIRDAWDRGTLHVLTRKDPLTATDAHVSIVGHITIEELRRELNDIEASNGFANRFLHVCVRRSKLLPDGGLPTDQLSVLSRKLENALQVARALRSVSWSPDARVAWHHAYYRLAQSETGMVGCVTARSEAQVVRLALIYAMIDGSPLIELPHLEAALAVWAYVENSAKYIFDTAMGDPVAERILQSLQSAGAAGLTRTQVSGLFGRHLRGKDLERAKNKLVQMGLVRTEERLTEGRSAKVYVANVDQNAGPPGSEPT